VDERIARDGRCQAKDHLDGKNARQGTHHQQAENPLRPAGGFRRRQG